MTKQELMETYTAEQLAEMVVKLDTASEISAKYIHNLEDEIIEKQSEINGLKCELKDLQIKMEEEYKPLEIEIENLRKNERELSEENAELHCELQAVNAFQEGYPAEPIKVADMLINASKKRTNCMTGKEYDKYIFEKWQLRQIAEHLLVYCNHNAEVEE